MKYSFLLLSLFIISNSYMNTLSAQTPELSKSWQQTTAEFAEKLQEANVVGGSLLFIEQGEVKAEYHHGYAELSELRRADQSTIYHWASLTKTLTAIGIMQLRDRGLLSLDDSLTDYLPELRQIHNPFGSMDQITIRMALNHSTGLRNSTWPWGGHEEWHPFEPLKWEQLVAMFPYSEIEFEPGSRYSYSNPAIIFLGKIIEQLSGDAWTTYIDKQIFKPLGMHNSYFNHTPPHLLPYRSNSYRIRNGEPEPRGLDFHTGVTTSNGGLNASVADMVTYLNFLLYPSEKHEMILRRSSLEELWKEELFIEETDGIRSSVGLSFFLEEFDGMRVVGHTGTQWSYYSWFYIHPESGTAVISVTNTEGGQNMHLFRKEMSHYFIRNVFSLYK